jgi:predicted regulator of Ras-like GTPase activity (Roadblock/LC7/MglB family)
MADDRPDETEEQEGAGVSSTGVGAADDYLKPATPRHPAPARYVDQVDRPGQSEKAMDESVGRLQAVHGVLGTVIFRGDGTVLKATLEPAEAVKLAAGAVQALGRARSSIAAGDTLQQLVIRTKRYEMLLSCSNSFSASSGFGMAVLQDPNLVVEKKVGVRDLVAKMQKLGLEVPPGADRAWLLELLEGEMMRRGM